MDKNQRDRADLEEVVKSTEPRRFTQEEERRLIRQAKRGNAAALEALVQQHLSFVAKLAREYQFAGLSFEDLINEGVIGLIQAVHRFDVKKDVKFITYAVWWIRQTIIKALYEKGATVRLPRYQYRRMKLIRAAAQSLAVKLKRQPSTEEIARQVETPAAKVSETLAYQRGEVSLDRRMDASDQGSDPLMALLGDPSSVNQEEALIHKQTLEKLLEGFTVLSVREREVLRRRYGFHATGQTETLDQIGRRISLTKERVRQIELRAKGKLRAFMLKQWAGDPMPVSCS